MYQYLMFIADRVSLLFKESYILCWSTEKAASETLKTLVSQAITTNTFLQSDSHFIETCQQWVHSKQKNPSPKTYSSHYGIKHMTWATPAPLPQQSRATCRPRRPPRARPRGRARRELVRPKGRQPCTCRWKRGGWFTSMITSLVLFHATNHWKQFNNSWNIP